MADSVKVPILSFDIPMPIDMLPPDAVATLVDKAWQKAKGPVQALARASGAKVNVFDPTAAASDLRNLKGRVGFEFYAAMGKSSVGAYWTDGKRSIRVLCEGKMPLDVEEKRSYLAALNGWSSGGNKLVTDADLKQFEADFPKKPKVYKDFQAMRKDSNAVAAFLDWARRKGGKPAKARDAYYDAFTGNRGLKDSDPVVVAALKALDEVLKEYYKSF